MTLLGNAVEDARRTGEWQWAIDEIEGALQLDIDDGARLALEGVEAFFGVVQGNSSEDELESLLARLAVLEDRDVAASKHDLLGYLALTRGDFLEAHGHWMQVVGVSSLNTPYCLPRAANAAVLAGDAQAARAALAQLETLGTRGRAIEADKSAIRAGIAAIEDNRQAALAGYRTAIMAWRDLALPWDEAMAGLSAVTRLGTDAPGVSDWVDSARAIYRRLDAAPMLALLDAAVAAGGHGGVVGEQGQTANRPVEAIADAAAAS